MDPLTHVTTGLILSQVIPMPTRALGALAGIFFALLPDIDYFFIYSNRLAYLKYHRGFTHSLLAMFLFALTVAAVGRLLGGPRWGRSLFFLGLSVLASHLLLDVATSYGTQLLNPFSRQKFALDWLFIIDPYLTGVLIIGAAAALYSVSWGRQVGISCLTLAGAYFLICGFYHHRALNLAHIIYERAGEIELKIAALPQPLSCRRWQLLAAGPDEIKQTMVQLPFRSVAASEVSFTEIEATVVYGSGPLAVNIPYQPPSQLQVYRWPRQRGDPGRLSPEVSRALDVYLAFARFPVLTQMASPKGEKIFLWIDLRFSVPGMPYPFVFSLEGDSSNRSHRWQIHHTSRGRWTK